MTDLIDAPQTETPTQPDVATTIERAILYLEEFGWTQGKTVAPDNSMCMAGALLATVLGTPVNGTYSGWDTVEDPYDFGADWSRPYSAAFMAIEDNTPQGRSLTGWNDEAGRTFSEVKALMKQTAAKARKP